MPYQEQLESIKKAWKSKDLTLYLGAGVSKGSGLPKWEELVLSMYIKTNEDILEHHRKRPFPNYLYAISDWLLKYYNEPLDVFIRKLKKKIREQDSDNEEQYFYELLYRTLYDTFFKEGDERVDLTYNIIADNNKTLSSIVSLLKKSIEQNKGIQSVISYNYDDLIESAFRLSNNSPQIGLESIFRNDQIPENNIIPIYHVHGFIPFDVDKDKSNYDELILSEESYNKAAQDAYYWGNMIQAQNLSANTGVMIGISLADKNIRRLLDAVKSTPVSTNNYILLLEDEKPKINPGDEIIRHIREKAENETPARIRNFRKLDSVEMDNYLIRVLGIVFNKDQEAKTQIFEDMGIKALWFKSFIKLAEFINKIGEE